MQLGQVISIVRRLIPVIAQTVKAIQKNSPGGKRITREERNIIIQTALARVGKILEDTLPK